MARVILGVAGGIAAYKSCELLRRLVAAGHSVRVVPTEAALEFVGAPTWSALSGQPVSTQVWDDVHEVPHVRLGQDAEIVVVAPATADLMARAAQGLAADLLGNVLLTARCPIVMAPAMHTEMWLHPATVANTATLRERGVMVIDPASGQLTGADSGPGRLPEPVEIATVVESVLAAGVPPRDLVGRRVLISAGGTRELIDPVRFLGNRSSGKQGYALAAAARDRGADVTLVAANCVLPDPAGVSVVPVVSAAQMRDAIDEQLSGAFDVVVMAAAVADYRPAQTSDVKVKKSGGGLPSIELTLNDDILAGLARGRAGAAMPLLIGFAAETGDHAGTAMEHARRKFATKGVDLLVVNEVGEGLAFEADTNSATILSADAEQRVPLSSKRRLAEAVWDAAVELGGWD